MDYSTKIAESLVANTAAVTAEVHVSATHRGRYRVYTFDAAGTMVNTWIVGIERNGSVTDNYRNVITTITL